MTNWENVLAESGHRFDSDFGLIKVEFDPNLAPGMAYFKTDPITPISFLFGGPVKDETDLFLGY